MRSSRVPLIVTGLVLALMATAQPQGTSLGTWVVKAPRPELTNEAAAVAIGGKLLAPGGSKQGKSLTRLDEYDPATDGWREHSPMPQPLDHLAVAVANGKLYTFGGFAATVHQGAADAALEYDPASDTWRRLKPMNAPRAATGAAVID